MRTVAGGLAVFRRDRLSPPIGVGTPRRTTLWFWAFGKSEKIVRRYPVRRCLEVFVSGRRRGDDHVDGILANVDVEFPVASLDPLDCFRFRNPPSRTAIVEAADVENAFVRVLSAALIDALDTFARSHRFSPPGKRLCGLRSFG